jgi:hypothetical protein
VTSYVYELPFGKGKPLASSGPLSWIVGGFRSSGSVAFASGRPLTPFANSNDSSIDRGLHKALPNVIGAPVMPRTVDCWYYASRHRGCAGVSGADAFVVPPAGVFGNAGRNTMISPGTKVFDFALHRAFPFGEARAVEFRWEVFNLTNTTQFGRPDTNVSGGSPGAITTLAGDARIMQFALRLKF